MKTIIIKVIDHKDQRYPTVGDWQFSDNNNTLEINISDLSDDKLNYLIAVHELIEALLCRFNDPEITTEQVDNFDMSHPELEEPGEDPRAPYKKQHSLASVFEIKLGKELKVNWEDYEKRIKEL